VTMEETTNFIADSTMELLQHIDEGVSLQTHMLYLLLVIICGYGLYRLYTFVFRRFF
jgi:hypothetical protein